MSNIKIGDMVMVVRACPYCGDIQDIGEIDTVVEVVMSDDPMDCCDDETLSLTAFMEKDPDFGWPVQILKRIPPLGELDAVKDRDEVTA